jgi:hypothetical protein
MAAKTPFEHINAIFTNQKVGYFDELNESDRKTFTPYVINMGISMNPDFLPYVNEVNKYWDELGPREVYLFYSQLLPKGKQYNRWIKGKKDDSYEPWLVDLISKHFGVSNDESTSYLRIYYKSDAGRKDLQLLLESYGVDSKKIKKVKL